MAAFDVKPDPQAPGNYTGYSQGIRASSNTALGTLFEGLANTLDMTVKEVDRQNIKAIEEDIFSAVDSVQDEFGVGSATDIEADAERGMLPQQLRRSSEHLAGLENAYQKGAIKESHYWARLNSMVRQLRGKYPGYRAEIDSMVSSVTGARPANALRNALFNEWEASKTDAESDPLFKLTDWASKNIGLPTDYHQRAEQGDPYGYEELQAYVSEVTTEKMEIQRKKDALSLQVTQESIDTKEVEKTARYEFGSFVNSLISDTTKPIGRNYAVISNSLRTMNEQIAAGSPPSQQEMNEYKGMINQLVVDVNLAMDGMINQPWSSENPNPLGTYAAQLSPEQIAAIKEQALLPIRMIEQGFNAESPWGVLGSVAAHNEAVKLDTGKELNDKYPVLPKLQAVIEATSPAVFDSIMKLQPEVQSSLVKMLLDLNVADTVLGTGTVGNALQRGQEAGADATYYKALQDQWVNTVDAVSSGAVPLEQVQQSVQFMFGEDSGNILAQFNAASKFEYFKKVASPEVTAQMVKLRDMGDTESWNTYQTWVSSAFMNLFQMKVREMGELGSTPAINVEWDPKNLRFSVNREAPPGVVGGGANPFHLIHTGIDMVTGVPGSKAANNLNSAIQLIAPILRENDADVAAELYAAFERMGYDPNQDGIIESLMKAVLGHAEFE